MSVNTKPQTCDYTILDIMKDGALSVAADAPVFKAISTMISRQISSLPVIDSENNLVGIISEKDVLKLLYDIEFEGGLVEEYMTRNVISFGMNDRVDDVLDCFVKNAFRRVAILHEGKLMSVVDRRDIIYANRAMFQTETKLRPESNEYTAKDVMTHGLFTAKVDTPISDAVDILLKRNIAGLPVVDDNMNLLGIISEKDIIDMIGGVHEMSRIVGEIMTPEVVSFMPDASLYDICDCLIKNDFRRVTILDHGKLVGIISRANIISFILRYRSTVRKQKISHDAKVS